MYYLQRNSSISRKREEMNIAPLGPGNDAASMAGESTTTTSEHGDGRSSGASQGSSSIRELLQSCNMDDLVSVITGGGKDTESLEKMADMVFENELYDDDDDLRSNASSLTRTSSVAPSTVAEWIEKTYHVQATTATQKQNLIRRTSQAIRESFENETVYSGGAGSVGKYNDPEAVRRKSSDFGGDADTAESTSMNDSESARIDRQIREMRRQLQAGGQDEAVVAANIVEALISSDDSSSSSYSSESDDDDSDESSSSDVSDDGESSIVDETTSPSGESVVGTTSSSSMIVDRSSSRGSGVGTSSSSSMIAETTTSQSAESDIGSSSETSNRNANKPQHVVAMAAAGAVEESITSSEVTTKSARRASQTEMDDMMAWLTEKEEMPDAKILIESPQTSASSISPEKSSSSLDRTSGSSSLDKTSGSSSLDKTSGSSSMERFSSSRSSSLERRSGSSSGDSLGYERGMQQQAEGKSQEFETIPEVDNSDSCDSSSKSGSKKEELSRQHSSGLQQLPIVRRAPTDQSESSFTSDDSSIASKSQSEDSISVHSEPIVNDADSSQNNMNDSMSLTGAEIERLTSEVRLSVRRTPLNLDSSFSSSSSDGSSQNSMCSTSVSGQSSVDSEADEDYEMRSDVDGESEEGYETQSDQSSVDNESEDGYETGSVSSEESYTSHYSASSNYSEDSMSVADASMENETMDAPAVHVSSTPVDLDESLSSDSSEYSDLSDSSETSRSVDGETAPQTVEPVAAVTLAAATVALAATGVETAQMPQVGEIPNDPATTSARSSSYGSPKFSCTNLSNSTDTSGELISVSGVSASTDGTDEKLKKELDASASSMWDSQGGDPALDYRAYTRALEGSKYLSTRDILNDDEIMKVKQRSYKSMQSSSSGGMKGIKEKARQIRDKVLISTAAQAVANTSQEKMQVVIQSGANETCYVDAEGEPFIDAECGLAPKDKHDWDSTEKGGLLGFTFAKEEKKRLSSRQKKILCYLLIFLFVVAPIAVAVGVLLKPDDDNSEDPNLYSLRRLLSRVALAGGTEFDDPNSYHSQALLWLAGDSNLDTYSREQKIQRWVLACVFFSTNNPESSRRWASTHGWLSDKNECSWLGVTCDSIAKSVTALELRNNGLSGVFPAEIQLLSETLTTLDLKNNYLTNSGDEGHAFFEKLDRLRFLHIGSNDLAYDGIPPQLGRLSDLIELDVSYTKYAGRLNGDVFEDMPVLNDLRLGGNSYNSSIPAQIGKLPSLEFLHIENAHLTGDLSFMQPMQRIFEMWLDKNPDLGGSIPTFVGDIPSLVSISVTECGLTGTIPTELGWLTDMQLMWFYSNKLTGTIPTELGNLPHMRRLELSENMLTGTMPQEICSNTEPPGILAIVEADCYSEVQCPCCTRCF